MSNEEVYLLNIEHELNQIKKLLADVVNLLSNMDMTLEEIQKKS